MITALGRLLAGPPLDPSREAGRVYDLNWDVVIQNRDAFLAGLRLGLLLAFFGLVIGCVLGLLLAFARTAAHPLVRGPAVAYIELIRNIPLLLLLFIFYFGVPLFAYENLPREVADRVVLDGERSMIVALGLYSSAYLAEIFRGGILAVGRRYLDAGRALGLTRFGVARYVTLPIMFRAVLPSLSNSFISLFKDTSLASAVAVHELTFAARKLSTDTFQVIEAWTTAGALYLATCSALAWLLRAAERRIRWSL